jgi:hypothetical protein
MTQSPDESTEKQKEIAYYSALVQAWIDNRMEKDKSILALSVAAIGLLVAIVTGEDNPTPCGIILFVISCASFLITITGILCIFSINPSHIEEVIKNDKRKEDLLTLLDHIVTLSFIVAIILAFVLGTVTVVNNYVRIKESTMQSASTQADRDGKGRLDEAASRESAANLSRDDSAKGKQKLDELSMKGIDKIRPKPTEPAPSSPTPAPESQPQPKQEDQKKQSE